MGKRTAVKVLFTDDQLSALPLASTRGNRVLAALAEWREMKNNLVRHGFETGKSIEPEFPPLVWGDPELGDKTASTIRKPANGRKKKKRIIKEKH